MFRHPNYYKNLRKLARNRDLHVRPILGSVDSATDQAISTSDSTECSDKRAPDPGPKLQAPSESSNKPQASSPKQQASSFKPQASSSKI